MSLRWTLILATGVAITALLWPFHPKPQRIDIKPTWTADVTAVVLNWSRLSNVIRIATLLCSPSLNNTIAKVFIWNNSPQNISNRDFPHCPDAKLIIYNSPSNLYFQARFIACAQSLTPYCFLQDDDYLVLPEIIHTLRARLSESTASYGIHLLPSHEVLSTHLRTLRMTPNIHTGFAWLGHGTIVRRSHIIEFLSLLRHLNVSETELKMADNYFTLLSNVFPEVWFDQGIELGGGQPFTVGIEGEERNRRHINRALELLQQIMHKDEGALPYVSLSEPDTSLLSVSRAVCRSVPCLLETSIWLMPDVSTFGPRMFDSPRLEILDDDTKNIFYNFAPSRAVDDKLETAFCSPKSARGGEYITLDVLSTPSPDWTDIEMVLFVDAATEFILRRSKFASFLSGNWVASTYPLTCTYIKHHTSCLNTVRPLRECRIRMLTDAQETRLFRLQVDADLEQKWCIAEIWMHGHVMRTWT